MQIVIDMSEEMLEWVNDVNKFGNDYGIGEFIDLVKNGIVLPKNHGRLIDADAFIEKLKDVRKEVWLIWLTTDELMQEIIETLETSGSAESDAPTVLEKEAGDDEV